jgi:UDP-glucose 4-epimerase
MNKYLVTGGAGFIGSHVVKQLIQKGEFVRVVDNLSSGKISNLQNYMDKIDFINGDITNYETAVQSVTGMEYVIHQAALPSVTMSIEMPVHTNNNIVTGTVNILDAAVKSKSVKRVVQASSSAIYGDLEELPKHEKMLPSPISPYGAAKLTQEFYGKAFYRSYGLEVISLRYFNVFGENQPDNTDYSAVIPKFIKYIKENRRPIIYGDGLNSRDFVHVKNIVNANILACHAKWNRNETVINIGTGKSTTLNKLVDAINKVLETNVMPIYEKERAGDIKHSVSSINNAKEVLNYSVELSFEEGLRKLIQGDNI